MEAQLALLEILKERSHYLGKPSIVMQVMNDAHAKGKVSVRHLLSGAEGLSSRTSIGTSKRFLTVRADCTVMTLRALPSKVMEKTTLTGGKAEN